MAPPSMLNSQPAPQSVVDSEPLLHSILSCEPLPPSPEKPARSVSVGNLHNLNRAITTASTLTAAAARKPSQPIRARSADVGINVMSLTPVAWILQQRLWSSLQSCSTSPPFAAAFAASSYRHSRMSSLRMTTSPRQNRIPVDEATSSADILSVLFAPSASSTLERLLALSSINLPSDDHQQQQPQHDGRRRRLCDCLCHYRLSLPNSAATSSGDAHVLAAAEGNVFLRRAMAALDHLHILFQAGYVPSAMIDLGPLCGCVYLFGESAGAGASPSAVWMDISMRLVNKMQAQDVPFSSCQENAMLVDGLAAVGEWMDFLKSVLEDQMQTQPQLWILTMMEIASPLPLPDSTATVVQVQPARWVDTKVHAVVDGQLLPHQTTWLLQLLFLHGTDASVNSRIVVAAGESGDADGQDDGDVADLVHVHALMGQHQHQPHNGHHQRTETVGWKLHRSGLLCPL